MVIYNAVNCEKECTYHRYKAFHKRTKVQQEYKINHKAIKYDFMCCFNYIFPKAMIIQSKMQSY